MTIKQVEIIKSDQSVAGGCGCNCGCGDNSTSYIDLELLKDRFEQTYPDVAKIDIDHIDQSSPSIIIQKMNDIFAANKVEIKVDELNLDFILSKVLPLILVEGQIVAANDYPDEKQLYEAIISGEPIPKSNSCC